MGAGCTHERGSAPLTLRCPRQRCRATAQFNQAVERTTSQPTGRVAGGGVRGGWLAFAHFRAFGGKMKRALIPLVIVVLGTSGCVSRTARQVAVLAHYRASDEDRTEQDKAFDSVAAIAKKNLRLGMTQTEVRHIMGRPELGDVNRQVHIWTFDEIENGTWLEYGRKHLKPGMSEREGQHVMDSALNEDVERPGRVQIWTYLVSFSGTWTYSVAFLDGRLEYFGILNPQWLGDKVYDDSTDPGIQRIQRVCKEEKKADQSAELTVRSARPVAHLERSAEE